MVSLHIFVATDASNKGNRKMFPVCVRYFSVADGVQSKLLDFYEDSDEMANGIHKALMTCLEKYELNVQNATSYVADNANVNYGKNHSAYKLSSANERILKANCPAHIAHHVCKHSCDQLSIDIETIVQKIYSHFSVSASRREELRSFFAFVDIEWREILRHVCTRWLSLHPAVSRLLESLPALTSYFRSLGETCPAVLKRIFQEEEKTDTAEIYLSFFHNVGCVFDHLVKKLEITALCITDVYEEVRLFKMKMLQRKQDSLFGQQTKQLVNKQLPAQKTKLQQDFNRFYDSVIAYIGKWFDFSSENVMVQLKPIGLYNELSFTDLEKVVAAIKLRDKVNMDHLYEEFCASKEEMKKAIQDTTKSTSEK